MDVISGLINIKEKQIRNSANIMVISGIHSII